MQRTIYCSVGCFINFKMFSTSSRKFTKNLCQEASVMFQSAYKSVQPSVLMQRAIEVHENSIVIQEKSFPLAKNVYIIGFGKAVLGMAAVVDSKLKGHNVSGIISIPKGAQSSLQ